MFASLVTPSTGTTEGLVRLETLFMPTLQALCLRRLRSLRDSPLLPKEVVQESLPGDIAEQALPPVPVHGPAAAPPADANAAGTAAGTAAAAGTATGTAAAAGTAAGTAAADGTAASAPAPDTADAPAADGGVATEPSQPDGAAPAPTFVPASRLAL